MKYISRKTGVLTFLIVLLVALSGCGHKSGGNQTYSVGGNASGLNGSVVLQNNGGDNLTVSKNGNYAFATELADGSEYNVTIATQPTGQTCVINNASGTISGADVTNVAVTCTTNSVLSYSVGGSASGLTGNVVLQNNSGDDLTVSANGSFTFATSLDDGSAYSVSVLTQPNGQTCSVTNGSGTISGADVTNVLVNCTTNTYSIGGSASGLTGNVVLQNNSGDDLTVSANGSFTFATSLADGSAYSVSVLTQPNGQTCSVTNGSGTISGADVTNVLVNCTTNTYSIGGSASGLTGNVVLQNNSGDDLTVSANGSFTFATSLADGSAYSVSVLTQPNGQTCSVTNGSSTINGADVTNVAVTCTTNIYSIGGTLSGLDGNIVLQNNGGDDLALDANGSFVFSTKIAYGDSYDVTVATQPSTQTCTVANGSGTVSGNDVSDVNVTCITPSGTAQLGLLSGADVKIYKIEADGNRTLLYTETTLSGDMTTAGQFDAHLGDLSDADLYLYEVSGGEDIDANDDGVLDDTPTPNLGTIRLIDKGNDIKAQNGIRVTMVSDIIYKKFRCRLKEDPYGITGDEVKEAIGRVIGKDLNGDGVVDFTDMLRFNPVADADKLTKTYQRKRADIVTAIHDDDRFYYFGGVDYVSKLSFVPANMAFSSDSKTAYTVGGNQLKIIDINDTEHMSVGATLDIPNASDVAVSKDGKKLYVAAGDDGLQVVDITDPLNPFISDTNSLNLAGLKTVAISHSGSTLYVESTSTGDMSIIDLTATPIKVVGSVTLANYGYGFRNLVVSADDTKLFAATDNFYDINISDSTNPNILAMHAFGNNNLHKIAISKDESTAYCATYHTISLLDLSNADTGTITQISTYKMSGRSLALYGDTLYSMMSGIIAFDISTPQTLVQADWSNSNSHFGSGLMEITPDGSTLFASDFSAIDIGDAHDNPIIGRFAAPITKVTLSADNSLAYTTSNADLKIIDVSTDNNLSSASVRSDTSTAWLVSDIVLNDNETRAFIANGDTGVRIYDVSNPDISATLISTLDTNGSASSLVFNATRTRAYVADGSRGLKILDITDENNMTIVGSIDTAGTAYDVALSKDEKTVFLAARESGLQVIDISTETAPTLVTTYNEGGKLFYARALKLSADGSKLFVGGGGTTPHVGFSVLDVTTPSVPFYLATIDTDDTRSIVLSPDETRAYIADGGNSHGNMKIIDISDLNNVHVVGSIIRLSYGHAGTGIALSNDGKKAYLADGQAGMFVVNVCE